MVSGVGKVNGLVNIAIDSDALMKCFTVRFICVRESSRHCFLAGPQVITGHFVPGNKCKPDELNCFLLLCGN